MKNLSYAQRIEYCENPAAKRLLSIVEEKQSNLALSADVTTKNELLRLADSVGPEIAVLKTHIDVIEDFDNDLTAQLQSLSKKHQFILFEDRKFADIGSTVQKQYGKGIYRIAQWADITNAHCLPGPGVIEGLKSIGLKKERGLLLLAQMSSANNLLTPDYTKTTLEMAKQNSDFVIGFISQKKLLDDPQFIYLTPGVQFQKNKDHLGQQYNTPENILIENQSDIIIVGRGIYQSDDPISTAKQYRKIAWDAYQQRL